MTIGSVTGGNSQVPPSSSGRASHSAPTQGFSWADAVLEEPVATGANASEPIAPPRSLRTGMPPLRLPTLEEAAQLSSELSESLQAKFDQLGLSTTPEVGFRVDAAGQIQVSGERDDLGRIQAMLDADPHLQRSVRTLTAISSHAHALSAGDHAAFQAEYRASANAASVVSRYAHLFGHQPRVDIALGFAGSSVTVTADGQPLGEKKSQG